MVSKGMATLEEIFKSLKEQAQNGQGRRGQNGVIYVDRIIKLPGLQRFTLKINYASDGHYSLVFYRGNNVRKQFAVFPEDASELMTIANFLQKYNNVLSKYIKYGNFNRNTSDVVEVSLDEGESNNGSSSKQSSTKKQSKKQKEETEDIEEEFETE